ncbi:hypothetical protein CCUS01_15417 [Colletotrichum cuscutae]|uniref:Uncharacterized protein n=1 Tax=Colletotrichum cuscutae TaxID=1209917 RepID=A0AAI9VH61_9PEZI|nr:hypothetical protein CCUS01_15417 [Colletotrichum cuscutae]
MGAKTSLQQLRRQRASSGPDKVPVLVQTLDEYTRSITALYSYTSAAVVTEKAHATRRDASTRRNARGLRAGTHMEVAVRLTLSGFAPSKIPHHHLLPSLRYLNWRDGRDAKGTAQELGQTLLSTYHCCLESLILGFQQGMDLNNTIRLASPPTSYHRLSAAARPSGPLDADPARHKHLELRGQGTAATTRSSPAACRALKAW